VLKLKRFFILAIIVMTAVSLTARTAKKKTDREIDGLKGKVKSATYENIIYKIVLSPLKE
jgi:hypothetical protein